MNEEELEELKEFTIDLNDIDDLALGLEICSKKSNMVIQEFIDTIVQLQQENQELKEAIDKLSSQIKLYGKYNGEKCTRGFSMMTADFNKLLDILKEVE